MDNLTNSVLAVTFGQETDPVVTAPIDPSSAILDFQISNIENLMAAKVKEELCLDVNEVISKMGTDIAIHKMVCRKLQITWNYSGQSGDYAKDIKLPLTNPKELQCVINSYAEIAAYAVTEKFSLSIRGSDSWTSRPK